VELSAREAQQEQQAAAQEGGRERAGGGRVAAHPSTLAENDASRNGSGNSGVRNCRLPTTTAMNETALAQPTDLRPWPRSALVVLGLLLVAHAALIAWGVSRLFPENVYNAVDVVKLRQVSTSALLVLAIVVLLERRRPARAVALAVLIVATALFLPGTVLTVGWLLADAWLIGDGLLRRLQAEVRIAEKPDVGVAMLVGLALFVGAISVCGAFRIHYEPVYVVLLAVPVLFALPTLAQYVSRASAAVREPATASVAERAWLALLGVVLVLHLFTAAKPEVGFDAHTMHLQFARLVAATHAWHYDVGRYAWAVMPLGADWMFAAAYLLGGEASVRRSGRDGAAPSPRPGSSARAPLAGR